MSNEFSTPYYPEGNPVLLLAEVKRLRAKVEEQARELEKLWEDYNELWEMAYW